MATRVLVVEDDEEVAEFLRTLLAVHGFEVSTVFNGDDALEAALRFAPAVILLDLMLPGTHGLELCRMFRAEPALAGARIVIISARDYPGDEELARDLGADAYLLKPLLPASLLAYVRGSGGTPRGP